MKKTILSMICLLQTMTALSQNTVYDAIAKQAPNYGVYLNAIEQPDYKYFHSNLFNICIF